ncbi:hypothetical protein F2Q69_00012638 [Brassica cretica]|uniref:Uncharacterized protein n=1 Tax=Brassica cretica TaxID=69181 RepID=A0A8S9QRI3_BRACR|nr:hypothetical protein F2Q69_00012638 [Brassica cretica]
MPQRYTVQRPGEPHPHQPEAALPQFPPMPDMRSVRASSPSAAGQSRQRRGDSEETTDKTTDEE